MAEIEASQIAMEGDTHTNEELRKTNEDLHRNLHRQGRRTTWERPPDLSSRDDPSRLPTNHGRACATVLHHAQGHTSLFGIEDPKNHLKAFRAQMIISEGQMLSGVNC